MNDAMWDLLKTVFVALISSGSVTAIIKRYVDKHSKVNEIEEQLDEVCKVINRQADAIQALLNTQMKLLDVLHDKKVINGESQKLRDSFSEYMYSSQAKGLKVKEKRA